MRGSFARFMRGSITAIEHGSPNFFTEVHGRAHGRARACHGRESVISTAVPRPCAAACVNRPLVKQ